MPVPVKVARHWPDLPLRFHSPPWSTGPRFVHRHLLHHADLVQVVQPLLDPLSQPGAALDGVFDGQTDTVESVGSHQRELAALA